MSAYLCMHGYLTTSATWVGRKRRGKRRRRRGEWERGRRRGREVGEMEERRED